MPDTSVHPIAQEVQAALVSGLASVVGSKLETEATVAVAAGPFDAEWAVQLSIAGSAAGRIVVAFPAATASGLTAIESAEEPAAEAQGDWLESLWSRVAAGLGGEAPIDGLTVTLETCARAAEDDDPPGPLTWHELTAQDQVLPVGVLVRLAEVPAETGEGEPVMAEASLPPNLDVVLDIDLPLAIRFGQTEMTLTSLARVGPGSVIELDRAPEDPVDVMVNGHLVAKGEVVVVSGNYAVRVTEVVSTADRLRSLGA